MTMTHTTPKARRYSLFAGVFNAIGAVGTWYRSTIQVPVVDPNAFKVAKDAAWNYLKVLLVVSSMTIEERIKWNGSRKIFNEALTTELLRSYDGYPQVVPQGIDPKVMARQFVEWQGFKDLRTMGTRLVQFVDDTMAIRETVLGQSVKDGVGLLVKQADDEAEAGATESVAMEASSAIQDVLAKIKAKTAQGAKGKADSLAEGQQNLSDIVTQLNEVLAQNAILKQEVQDLQHQLTLSTGPAVPSVPAKTHKAGGTKATPAASSGTRQQKR